MSKLYTEYLRLKKVDSSKIYLFKSGIFFISLDEDAKKLAEIFSFKLTYLNENVVKCGFPQNRLEYYISQLTISKIPFEIVDLNYSKIDNYSDYLNNIKIKNIIDSIIDIDMNNITFKQSFEFLDKIKKELGQIFN